MPSLQRFVKSSHALFASGGPQIASLGLLLAVLLLQLQPALVLAQANVNAPWVKFTRNEGLVSNNVLSILVDDEEIWFGTDNGISRFTGQWESYYAEPNGFSGAVLALAQGDGVGGVWAGTDEGELLHWNGQRWEQQATTSSPVLSLLSVEGRLWVGTENGLYVWTGADLLPVDELKGQRVQVLKVQAGVVWVGVKGGLWVYQRDVWSFMGPEDGLPGTDVTALWVDPTGPVWVAADGRIAWRSPTTGAWTSVSTEVLYLNNPAPIIALVGDRFGDIWGAAYGSGAFRIRNDMLLAFSGEGENGLTTPFVQTLAVDPDGLVWFGTASGVFRFDGRMWLKELGDNVLYPGINRINDLAVGPDHQLWIATGGAGIRLKTGEVLFTPERIYTESDGNLPTNFINSIVLDPDGVPWAGTFIGVSRYNQETDSWEQPFPPDALPSELVTALLADGQKLWIGSDKGLAVFDREQQTLEIVPELEGINVLAMTVDSLNQLWVGSGEGVYLHTEDGTWQHFVHQEGDSNSLLGDTVVSLATDPNASGAVWAGVQEAGLNYWDGRQWSDYTDVVGLPSKLIYRVYTDPGDGSLWVGSEGGVTRYDGRTAATLNVPGALPAAGVFAITRDAEGNYWFGGRDGLTFYRPERTPPWVKIRDVYGLAYDIFREKPEVEANQDVLIQYVAGDLYTRPEALEVLYRVSGPGRMDAWQVASSKNSIRLAGFQEGAYLIELQARDEAFNYSTVERFTLEVAPPPPMVNLPFWGPMRRDYFTLFVVMGGIALLGVASIGIDIAQSRRRAREAITRGFNPFVSGEPVRREDMFFGRDELLQQIIDTLHNNSIMIHGERRIGKTTLLYQLAARLREIDDPEYWFVPLYIDLEGTTEQGFFHFLMEEILNGVMTLPQATQTLEPLLDDFLYQRTPGEEYSDREFGRDLRRLIHALNEYGDIHHPNRQLRLILLLDEMDVMSDYSHLVQQQLRRIFMRDFAATLGAVVAGIQISKEWDRIESPWYNLFNEIELTPFAREQALELLLEPVQGYYRYDPAALEFIIEKSEGRPYRLQQYALEAVNIMLSRGRRTITLDDVEQAHEHIERMGHDLEIGLNGSASSTQSGEGGGAGDPSPNGADETSASDSRDASVEHVP